MFRQLERLFMVGALSGGAGGEGGRGLTAAPELTFTERTLKFELVPVEHWDTPGSPAGNGVADGTVHFYRPGDYTPSYSAPAGEPVPLPVGRWHLAGEAPGWVTSHRVVVRVARGEQGGGSLVSPVLGACEVSLEEKEAWDGVERVDLVSLTESAVFPLVLGERRSARVPAGRFLAYSVSGERISGIGRERTCEPGDRLHLAPPPPPGAGRQALVVGLLGSRAGAQKQRDVVEVVTEGEGGQTGAIQADATVWINEKGFAFFTDLPAVPVRVRIQGRESDFGEEKLGAEEKTVREVRIPGG